MRRIEFATHRLFAVVLIASVCVFGAAVFMAQTETGDRMLRSLSAPPQVTLIPGTAAVPAEAEPALRAALARDAAVVRAYYAVTAFDCDSGTCFASVAGFDELEKPDAWTLNQAVEITLVVLVQRADGGYEAAREDEARADGLLSESQAPGARKLSVERRLRAAQATTETVRYDFPWPLGTSMYYGTLGVHRGGFINGWKAVDLLSDGDVGAGHSPNEVIAAADGVITYVCNDGVNVAVRIGGLMYVHLLPNESRLRVGETFRRGEVLGSLKSGSFSARCGYASQQSRSFHLHLAFPDAPYFTMGGWTLDMSDGVWRRGDATWRPGRWLRNDGDPNVPPPTPGPTRTPTITRTPRPTRTATATPTRTIAASATLTPVPTHTATAAATPTATPCPSGSNGDADCDGVVDGVDYSYWLSARSGADFNRDGAVDEQDFVIWLRNRTAVTTDLAAREEPALLEARLVLTEAAALRDAVGVREVDLAIEVSFAPASPTRTLHYARVELAIPTDTLRMPVGGALNSTQSGLGRVIDATNAEQIDAAGFLRIELGAESEASAPSTGQTITLALGRFRIARELREPAVLMLYGAQFVTGDAEVIPIRFTTLEIWPERRVNLPIVVDAGAIVTPTPSP